MFQDNMDAFFQQMVPADPDDAPESPVALPTATDAAKIEVPDEDYIRVQVQAPGHDHFWCRISRKAPLR